MPDEPTQSVPDYLAAGDDALLAQCEVHVYRSSGPGGQHRNKVSSAVRLHHRPTGISAHGDESRSQHDNKRQALARLRMKIACCVRRPVAWRGDPARVARADRPAEGRAGLRAGRSAGDEILPPILAECIFSPKGAAPDSPRRLQVGRKDHRFWTVAQFLLDLLGACEGRLADAAGALGISTSNLASILMADRHLHAAANDLRKRHGQGPVK